MIDPRPDTHFDSDDHALATGMLIGLLSQAGIKVTPVMDDEGNYVPRVRVWLDIGHLQLTPIDLTVAPVTLEQP